MIPSTSDLVKLGFTYDPVMRELVNKDGTLIINDYGDLRICNAPVKRVSMDTLLLIMGVLK